MLQVKSSHKLQETETLLRRAAQKFGCHLLTVSHLGQLLPEEAGSVSKDAFAFSLCHPKLAGALLCADIRFAAFLPCKIGAYSTEEGVTLEAVPPREYCRLLHRPDLERLVLPLETLLREIMEETAKPAEEHPHPAHTNRYSMGATENEMNIRGSIPQRIDCQGSKVEDLAGTGQHDAAGG